MISFENLKQFINAVMAKRKKPNWEQCDSSQEDYIENRPFYKEKFEMKFSDEDYNTPFYESVEDGERWYKISDDPMVLDGLNNIVITYGKTANDIKNKTMHLGKYENDFVENDDSQLICCRDNSGFYFSEKSTIKLIVSMSLIDGKTSSSSVPALAISYDKFNIGDGYDEDFPKGIYVAQKFGQELIKLYGISAVKCHKIPSEFLPDDYINSSQESYIKELLGGAS